MPAKLYQVLKIDEMTRLSETGGIEKFYRHQIKTKAGVVRTVDVSERDFTVEKVKALLTAMATEADQIMAL